MNRAALELNVPRTMKDRVSGRVVHGCNMGPKTYLTNEEEKELVDFLLKCSKMGYAKMRQIVHSAVQKKEEMNDALQKKKEKKLNKISHGWWVRFCRRWPQLRLRKGDSFPIVRDQMTNYTVFNDYFNLLAETLTNHGINDKPSQIYNCDESGMPLEHKMPKVIAAKGTKKVRQCTSDSKTQITILACASTSGQAIPPMVVFSFLLVPVHLDKLYLRWWYFLGGTLTAFWLKVKYLLLCMGCLRQAGWTRSYLQTGHFLKHAVSIRPLMLLLDGHLSHYTVELVKLAAEHDMILFCLPPHTTADCQPLDTTCFKLTGLKFAASICLQIQVK